MLIGSDAAAEVARNFFGASGPLERVGWGISGFVYLSPDLRTVLKVYHRADGFDNELLAYQILQRRMVSQLYGLSLPKLRDFRRDPMMIQMDFVSPPYLLDFAGVEFSRPDLDDDDAKAGWQKNVTWLFAPMHGSRLPSTKRSPESASTTWTSD